MGRHKYEAVACPAKWNVIFMNCYIVHFIFMANKKLKFEI